MFVETYSQYYHTFNSLADTSPAMQCNYWRPLPSSHGCLRQSIMHFYFWLPRSPSLSFTWFSYEWWGRARWRHWLLLPKRCKRTTRTVVPSAPLWFAAVIYLSSPSQYAFHIGWLLSWLCVFCVVVLTFRSADICGDRDYFFWYWLANRRSLWDHVSKCLLQWPASEVARPASAVGQFEKHIWPIPKVPPFHLSQLPNVQF